MTQFLAQAEVAGAFQHWFVSTINRESSAAMAAGHIYAETLVWEYDPFARIRGDLIWMGEDCAGRIKTHMAVIERLYLTGSPDEPKEAE